MSYINRIPQIIAITQMAAQAIMDIYQKEFEIKTKLDNSPVTTADLQSHTIIENALKELTPEIPILSEEGGVIPLSERTRWSSYWLIDPLDGTKEFIKKSGEFTINIALIENNEPIIGVVFAPVLKELYWAAKGENAYFQKDNHSPTIIKTSPFPITGPIKVILSRDNHGHEEEWQKLLARIKEYELIYCGSALKICLIARGYADLYPRFGATSEWDTAAGQCILEAAGGSIVDRQGKILQYNRKDNLINPSFFAMNSSKLTKICCE